MAHPVYTPVELYLEVSDVMILLGHPLDVPVEPERIELGGMSDGHPQNRMCRLERRARKY